MTMNTLFGGAVTAGNTTDEEEWALGCLATGDGAATADAAGAADALVAVLD